MPKINPAKAMPYIPFPSPWPFQNFCVTNSPVTIAAKVVGINTHQLQHPNVSDKMPVINEMIANVWSLCEREWIVLLPRLGVVDASGVGLTLAVGVSKVVSRAGLILIAGGLVAVACGESTLSNNPLINLAL